MSKIYLVFHDAGPVELVSAFSSLKKANEEMRKIRAAHKRLGTKVVDLYHTMILLNESKAEP